MSRPIYHAPQTARVAYLGTLNRLLIILAGVAALFYFPYRISTFNPDALVLSLLFYAAEVFGFVTIALHAFMTWRLLKREAPEPLPDATVDVFIPTYNEPVDMLRRTAMAARNMNYPHETWLLDDGRRPEMAALAKELGIHYLSRDDNVHAKAGNLNNALAHSSGEFIAIFDADHVPHANFTVRTLGYFADSSVAFVQTPQDFYNLDSFQHRRGEGTNLVWTEQSLFFRVIMQGKDYWNASFFCGSCAIIRRSALEQIGGFATETVTEDLHTSVRLHKNGYGSVYHSESLAYGIAPATFEPYETQRIRWGQGAMQVWRREGIIFGSGLTLPQRLCYVASMITYFDGWQKAFMFLLPSFVLVTGILPVADLDWNFMERFLAWYALSLCACEELGRGYARSWTIEQYNFLRSPGFAFATLTFFLNRRLRFRVTAKGGSSTIENLKRMSPQFTLIAITSGSLVFGTVRYMIEPHLALGSLIFNITWCIVAISIATSALRFALGHAKQERASYRFHVPIPVGLRDAAGRMHIVPVDNISSSGFSAVVPDTLTADEETTLEAELILPSGTTPVRLEVVRNTPAPGPDGNGKHTLAVKFDWMSPRDVDALDLCMYGSGAEWRYCQLREKEQTPVDWLLGVMRSIRAQPDKHSWNWQPAIVVPADLSHSIEVLASSNDAESASALLSHIPIKAGKSVAIILPQGHIANYRITSLHLHEGMGRQMFLHLISRIEALPQDSDLSKRPEEARLAGGAAA